MTRAWLAVLVVCSCWRGAPPPEPPADPPPIVPRPRMREIVEPPPPKTPRELAEDLTRELRDNPGAPQQYLGSQVLHDDLKLPTQQTHSGRAADTAASHWGQLLFDPARTAPRCHSGSGRSFICMQITHGVDPTLILNFCRGEDTWELVGVFEGDIRSLSARQRFVAFHAAISKSCP